MALTKVTSGGISDIAAAVEGASDSNKFTDADHSKLNAIEASATADQTNAEIRAAVEAASDSNVFTDADHTKLNGVAASANNYVHPNHSGEVTSSADGATVIADNIVDEANLKISNAPTNGYVLTAQSGNTGGMTWAEMTGGGPSLGTDSIIRTNAQTISENITIGSTTNGMSAGPITIADGYTVTVNGNWSVV
jgi:hypothetical protein